MSPEPDSRIQRLYHAAISLPEAERTVFVRSVCAGDAEMYGKLMHLLEARSQAHSSFGSQTMSDTVLRIGRYVLVRELGRGGP